MKLINTNSTNYKKVKQLGEGSFGEVFLVQNIKDNSFYVSKDISIQGMSEKEQIQMFIEAKILEALKHPNIVRLNEFYKTKSKKLVLILEYAEGGDLKQYVEQQTIKKQQIEEKTIIKWLIQLCLAIKHSHDNNIVHRDLKTENVFIHENNLKLGDFGLAKNLKHQRTTQQGVMGTPLYLAPEIINESGYSYKADVWSLGIIMFEIMNLEVPFFSTTFGSLLAKILHSKIPELNEYYSQELRSFVKQMLERDVTKRPSIDDLLTSDFLASHLLQNMQEFKTLIQSNKTHDLRITENGLKNDLASLKTYRFSQYTDTASILQEFQQNIPKVSHFAKNAQRKSSFRQSKTMQDLGGFNFDISQSPVLESEIQCNNFFKDNCKQQNSQQSSRKSLSSDIESEDDCEMQDDGNHQIQKDQTDNNVVWNNNLFSEDEEDSSVQTEQQQSNQKVPEIQWNNNLFSEDSIEEDEEQQQQNQQEGYSQDDKNKDQEKNENLDVSDVINNNSKQHKKTASTQDANRESVYLNLTKNFAECSFLKQTSIQNIQDYTLEYSQTLEVNQEMSQTSLDKKKDKNQGIQYDAIIKKTKTCLDLVQPNFRLKTQNKLQQDIFKKSQNFLKPKSKLRLNASKIQFQLAQKNQKLKKQQFLKASSIQNSNFLSRVGSYDQRDSVNVQQISKNCLQQIDTNQTFKAQKTQQNIQNIKRNYRKSKMNQIDIAKKQLIGRIGTKFNLLYSISKKFVLKQGLVETKSSIHQEPQSCIQKLNQFSNNAFEGIKNKQYILKMLNLTIAEIRNGLIQFQFDYLQ